MAIVEGVDFGTLSVRVSIVDSVRGLLATALAEYPLHRKRDDPEYATQSHGDQMQALAAATREAVRKARITTFGVIIAQKQRPRRSRKRLTEKGYKRFSGAAACIPPSGDLRNCCIGYATIQRSARNSFLPSSTVIWRQQRFAELPIRSW